MSNPMADEAADLGQRGRAGDLLMQALPGGDGDGIVTLAADGTVRFANAAALRLLGGEDSAGLRGRPWRDHWPEASRPAAEAALAAARDGRTGRFQAVAVAAGRWVSFCIR